MQYGSFITARNDQPTLAQIKGQKKVKLDYPYNPGAGMYTSTVMKQLDRSFLEPFLGKLYSEVIPVSSQDEAFNRMEHDRLPHQAFIEKYKPRAMLPVTEEVKTAGKGRVDLTYSSFNRLDFRAVSPSPSIFGMAYPYSGKWSARVNGEEVPVHRANGGAHAVEIPEGESIIEFRYWSPGAFWGMVVSCGTFIIIGITVSVTGFRRVPRLLVLVAVLTFGLGGAHIWNQSLYSGGNLGTEYTWENTPSELNFAYGKKTSLFPPPEDIFYHISTFYRTHTSKLVDGNKNPAQGYLINLEYGSAVTIDLYRQTSINSIILHESINGPSFNDRQLTLSISSDRENWKNVASITSNLHDHNVNRIDFDSSKTARYLKIIAAGNGNLSLDEVEVYGE